MSGYEGQQAFEPNNGQQREQSENAEWVKSRLQHLMEISRDPYYDQFLAQVKKDLESGKATPRQAMQVLERSYLQYQQRMGLTPEAPAAKAAQPTASEQGTAMKAAQPTAVVPKKNVEIKVGVHLFGLVGAVFVLAAFVIFSYNFMSGFGQGICLYAAALALTVFSELYVAKKLPGFSAVLTGLGTGGLYAANIVNFYSLKTINAFAAILIFLIIAMGAIFLSRRRESLSIRLISLMGCYISCFFAGGFLTELNFLMTTAVLLIVNMSSIFLSVGKHQKLMDCIHIWLNLIFVFVFANAASAYDVQTMSILFFTVAAFAFSELLCLCRCRQGNTLIFVFSSIINGLYIFLFFVGGVLGDEVDKYPAYSLTVHILFYVLIAVIAAVMFLLWNKKDGRRWAQVYYVLGTILLVGSFSEHYEWEAIITSLVAFAAVKLLASKKEIRVLDCVISIYFLVMGMSYAVSYESYWWIYAAAVFLSIFMIRQKHIFHEIAITVGMLYFTANIFDYKTLEKLYFTTHLLDNRMDILENGVFESFSRPASMLVLLLLFLMFNHLPMLRGKRQKAYNITAAVFAGLFILSGCVPKNPLCISLMMVMGAVLVLVMFRRRYEMEIPRKYLVLAGTMAYLAIVGKFGSPVVSSILLMIIALACVWIGFLQRDKVERICGLVLAGFVCLKLVLYDFREVDALYRAMVFLAVGVIALLISFFYILLEKREEQYKTAQRQTQPSTTVQPDMTAQESAQPCTTVEHEGKNENQMD